MKISKKNLWNACYFFLVLGLCASNLVVAGSAEPKGAGEKAEPKGGVKAEAKEGEKAAQDDTDDTVKAAMDLRAKKEQDDKDSVDQERKDADTSAQQVHDAMLKNLLASSNAPAPGASTMPGMDGQMGQMGGQMAQNGP